MRETVAHWVLGRLITVDELMDEVLALGDMIPGGPQADWDEMAGQIPEKV
jgi:hypothetical protein